MDKREHGSGGGRGGGGGGGGAGGLALEVDLEESDVTSLDALGELLEEGEKLQRLEIINLYSCQALYAIPPAFGTLANLKEVYIMRCHALKTLPASFRHLPPGCMVNVWECGGLTSLPDLSGRLDLTIEAVPERLAGWEAGGRHAFVLSGSRLEPSASGTEVPPAPVWSRCWNLCFRF